MDNQLSGDIYCIIDEEVKEIKTSSANDYGKYSIMLFESKRKSLIRGLN